jgi:hypothetical protein
MMHSLTGRLHLKKPSPLEKGKVTLAMVVRETLYRRTVKEGENYVETTNTPDLLLVLN